MFAVCFYAVKFPIDTEDRDSTSQDSGGLNIFLSQVSLPTNLDSHVRSIVICKMLAVEILGCVVSLNEGESKTIVINYLSRSIRAGKSNFDARGETQGFC